VRPRLIDVGSTEPRRWPARSLALLAGWLATAIPAATEELRLPGSAEPLRLDVASYNVQFATPDAVAPLLREWPGHKPNVEARARAIARRLACRDVIAFQETINHERRLEMFDELEASGRGCGQPSRLPSGRLFAFADGPDLPDAGLLPLVGDELALASRLPILHVRQHRFEAAAGEDVLAAKGVLHARLALPGDGVLDVFVTHLQADSQHAPVRRRQIDELAAFVQGRPDPNQAMVLVMGDLNVWGGAVDRADSSSEYNHLMRALSEAVRPRHLVDLWLATHPDDPETESGTKRRRLADGTLRPREKRIDYILMAAPPHVRPLAMARDFLVSDLVIDGEPLGDLSNHAALLASIRWSASAAALSSIADGDPRPTRIHRPSSHRQ
jgi:endonuclease/exonuclease/phosphatase family metal-dependent hydrolase